MHGRAAETRRLRLGEQIRQAHESTPDLGTFPSDTGFRRCRYIGLTAGLQENIAVAVTVTHLRGAWLFLTVVVEKLAAKILNVHSLGADLPETGLR